MVDVRKVLAEQAQAQRSPKQEKQKTRRSLLEDRHCRSAQVFLVGTRQASDENDETHNTEGRVRVLGHPALTAGPKRK